MLPGNVHYMEANWAAASSQVLSATNCSTNNTLEVSMFHKLNFTMLSFLDMFSAGQQGMLE